MNATMTRNARKTGNKVALASAKMIAKGEVAFTVKSSSGDVVQVVICDPEPGYTVKHNIVTVNGLFAKCYGIYSVAENAARRMAR